MFFLGVFGEIVFCTFLDKIFLIASEDLLGCFLKKNQSTQKKIFFFKKQPRKFFGKNYFWVFLIKQKNNLDTFRKEVFKI